MVVESVLPRKLFVEKIQSFFRKLSTESLAFLIEVFLPLFMTLTVKEYALIKGLGLKAVYRQIKEGRLTPGVTSKRMYGRIVLDVPKSIYTELVDK